VLRVGKLTDRTALEVLARGQAEHPRLRALAKAGSLTSRHFDQDIYGCRAVKDALWELQSSRCCFCEREYESAHSTVEHFRPKSSAKRAEKTFDPGYWWLAYDPDNLLFACAVCNNLKRDWFPLESGAAA
jgi:5-methylcytosine-specific restriction endonuclease McrA